MNYDHYASLMLLWMPIAFHESVYHRRLRLIALASVAVMTASAIAGGSRAGTGLLSAALLLGILHSVSDRRGVSGLTTLAVMIGGVMVAGWELVFLRFQLPDLWAVRSEFYRSSLSMIWEKPWTGFGLGAWVKAYGLFGVVDVGIIDPNAAHNDWLQFGAEQGLLADALLLYLLIWTVVRARQKFWGIGVAAVLVHCAVDFPLQILPGRTLARRHRG